MFEDFMNDTISIQKQNGDKIEGLKASVQSPLIHLENPSVIIEVGDLVERRMSNGAVETYEVLDPVFHEEFHGMPASYQLKVRKLGIPEPKSRTHNITYNISGHNARLNQNSTDSSTNTISIGNDLRGHVEALKQAVATLNDAERQDASEIVSAVEANLTSQKPSKTVVKALLSALPHLANIGTITSSILAAL